MSQPDYKAELEQLGYFVGEAMPGTLFIEGWGMASYVLLDDTETLDSLLDPGAHAERVDAFENPPEPPAPTQDPTITELSERIEALEGELGA
jgi:hypothetical protein